MFHCKRMYDQLSKTREPTLPSGNLPSIYYMDSLPESRSTHSSKRSNLTIFLSLLLRFDEQLPRVYPQSIPLCTLSRTMIITAVHSPMQTGLECGMITAYNMFLLTSSSQEHMDDDGKPGCNQYNNDRMSDTVFYRLCDISKSHTYSRFRDHIAQHCKSLAEDNNPVTDAMEMDPPTVVELDEGPPRSAEVCDEPAKCNMSNDRVPSDISTSSHSFARRFAAVIVDEMLQSVFTADDETCQRIVKNSSDTILQSKQCSLSTRTQNSSHKTRIYLHNPTLLHRIRSTAQTAITTLMSVGLFPSTEETDAVKRLHSLLLEAIPSDIRVRQQFITSDVSVYNSLMQPLLGKVISKHFCSPSS